MEHVYAPSAPFTRWEMDLPSSSGALTLLGARWGGEAADDLVELLTQPAVRRRATSEPGAPVLALLLQGHVVDSGVPPPPPSALPPPLSIICFPSFCLRCVDCRGSLEAGRGGWHWELLQTRPNVDRPSLEQL